MRTRTLLCICWALGLVAGAAGAALPEGHPRLFFDAEGRAALRQRAAREPYASMLARMRHLADHATFDREADASVLYDMRIRHWASAYALTGEAAYARKAEAAARKLVADTAFWQDPGSKGLTRAAGALSAALAYDVCHDAWSPETRALISRELLKAARGLMTSMGRGANNHIANNWQGVRYGAAGLAALACDEPGREALVRDAYTGLDRHIGANLGQRGWNPEGIGYTVYPATFTGPFGVAAARAGVGDLRDDQPKFRETFWTLYVGTVPIPNSDALGLRADLADDHPRYAGHGTAGLAFWYAPEAQRPALKWMYDRLHGRPGPGTWDADSWGGGLYSLLFYPADVEARNPADVPGLNYVDASHGLVLFRNRYRDENDIVAVVNAHARQPAGCHGGPDTNTLRILGLGGVFVTGGGRTGNTAGQTNLFAGPPPRRGTGGLGELVSCDFEPGGPGGGRCVTRGSSMGVEGHVRRFLADYSGAAGADALFANVDHSLNGRVWRLNTPEFNEIQTAAGRFVLRAPNGATLAVTVLEPAAPTFRTGTVERGGGAGHTGFPYRGTKYLHNRWIEFDCDARVAVVMTLQQGAPPPVAVARSLHGAEARVGKALVAYEKGTGRLYTGDKAASLALADRKTPLRPRGLEARTVAADAVELTWLAEDLGGETLILQRAWGPTETDVEPAWQDVARVRAASGSHTDRRLPSAASFVWRLVTVSAAGRSEPSAPAAATTWEAGYALHVEDFAAPRRGRPTEHSFGPWKVADGDRGWRPNGGEGSPRLAAMPAGFMATGSVRIGKHNALFTDAVRCDLSGQTAWVAFDWRDQAVTRVGIMLKLADGRWVVSPPAFLQTSRDRWQTHRVDIAAVKTWQLADPAGLRLGKKVTLEAKDLADVRGLGLWGMWVINQKWAHVDQFTVCAKGFRPVGR